MSEDNEISYYLELVPTEALAEEILARSDDGIVMQFRENPGDNEHCFRFYSTKNFKRLTKMCAMVQAQFWSLTMMEAAQEMLDLDEFEEEEEDYDDYMDEG